MAPPKKAVKFSLITTIDPVTGKEKTQFVPQIRDDSKLTDKQLSIIEDFSGDHQRNEEKRRFEEEQSDFPPEHPLYEPPTVDPSTLTEEEVERFTVNGRFPNDGYDYSRHFRGKLAQGEFLANPQYEDPVDIKIEVLDGDDEDMFDYDEEELDDETRDLMRMNNLILDKRDRLPAHDFDNAEEAEKLTKELFDDAVEEVEFDFGEEDGEFEEDAHDDFDDLLQELQREPESNDLELRKERASQLKSILKKKLQRKIPDRITTEEYEREKQYLDDTFDAFFDQYEDQYIGQLDDMMLPEREIGHEDVKRILSEFQFEQEFDHFKALVDLTHDKDQPSEKLMKKLRAGAPEGYYVWDKRAQKRLKDSDLDRKQVLPYIESRVERMMNEDPDNEGTHVVEVKVREQWDCESIVSTYTNSINHPATVEEELTEKQKKKIELSKKNGVPLGIFEKSTEERKISLKEQLDQELEAGGSINLGAKRDKKEPKDLKKLRKQLQKELKRERREAKKELKAAFKQEELQQRKMDAIPSTRQKNYADESSRPVSPPSSPKSKSPSTRNALFQHVNFEPNVDHTGSASPGVPTSHSEGKVALVEQNVVSVVDNANEGAQLQPNEEYVGANLLNRTVVGKAQSLALNEYSFERNYNQDIRKRKRTLSPKSSPRSPNTDSNTNYTFISEQDANAFPAQAFILDESKLERLEKDRLKREEHDLRESKRQRIEAIKPKSEFHLTQKRDYKGRTFMAPPSWLKPVKRAGTIKCFEPKKLAHTFDTTQHKKGISEAQFFPRLGHLLLSASYDGSVKLWDVLTHKKCIMTYKGHTQGVGSISFRSDGRQFLSSGYDWTTHLWDTERGRVISTFKNKNMPLCCRFHPLQERNHQFLLGQQNGEITQWDARSNQVVLTYAQHKAGVKHLEYLRGRNGSYSTFASTSDDKTICLWYFTHKGKGVPTEIKKVEDPNNLGFHYMRQHPTTDTFLVGGFGSATFCYLENHPLYSYLKNQIFRCPPPSRPVVECSIDLSHDGELVLQGDSDGKVHIWNYHQPKRHKSFAAHTGACKTVLWHPTETSKMVTCGSEDGLIKLWE